MHDAVSVSEAAALVGRHLSHLGEHPLPVIVVVEDVDGRQSQRYAAGRRRPWSVLRAAVRGRQV